MRCSTKMIVVPPARISRMNVTALSISDGVRPQSTSSSSNSRGLAARARASSRNLRSCRLSCGGNVVDLRVSPVKSSQCRASAVISRAGRTTVPANVAAQRFDAKHDCSDGGREQGSQRRRDRDRQQERQAEAARKCRCRVDAGAEKRGMAEAPVSGVAAENAPTRRQRDPHEDREQIGQVEIRHAEIRHGCQYRGQYGGGSCDPAIY